MNLEFKDIKVIGVKAPEYSVSEFKRPLATITLLTNVSVDGTNFVPSTVTIESEDSSSEFTQAMIAEFKKSFGQKDD